METDKEVGSQRRSYRDIVAYGPKEKSDRAEKGGEKSDRAEMEGEEMQTPGNSKIYLEENNEMKAMMEKGLIGDTLEPYCFKEMERKLKEERQTLETVKMVGDMKVLMLFNSKENMEDAMKLEKMKRFFLEIRRWRPGEANRTRKFWLEITGLPIDGWSKVNMIKIGEVWGKVLEVEEAEGGHYSFFCVLVVANTGPLIRSWATIMINGINYTIFVKEDDRSVSWVSDDDKAQRSTEQEKTDEDAKAKANEPLGANDGSGDKEDGGRSATENHTQPEDGDATIREEEAKESRVGETQQLQSGRTSGSPECIAETGLGFIRPVANNCVESSPTKIATLEDDRTTDQVLQEWNEDLYQLPNEDGSGPDDAVVGDGRKKAQHLEDTDGCDMENSENDETLQSNNSVSSYLSASPGFEKIPQEGAINEQEKGTRKHKRIKGDQDSENEIENTEEEVEETWRIGNRVGIGAEAEDGAKKYLLSKIEEVVLKDSQRKKKAGRGRKKAAKEVGVSTDLES
ncbi:hypothetical protein PIB30_023565 [Stylosanthes scabra]|uniref:DUF4283 domain-containing protein n=1 Tax=Stylosanthes scabra TaxID=79078 RepID=A0ABU6X9N7_9FABA|nr:hypothetical protein [Stylosanthes scabra]